MKKLLSRKIVYEMDAMTAGTIFLLIVLEYLSWILQEGEPATITDVGNNYLVWIYPLLNTIGYFIVSIHFLIKSFRFNACIYTIIVSILYFIIQLITVFTFSFGWGMFIYETIVYPILLIGIVLLTLTTLTRWFLR